jgi:tripartite-type tricarboxylate transporter receptor subunit TctC
MVFRKPIAACVLLLSVGAAIAQAPYPNKPIRLVVPFPAGGTADVIARTIAQQFTENTKQPMVVDNKPGADTIIGMQAVKAAPPDGYTVGYVIGSSLTMNPLLYTKLPYTVSDFVPVMVVAEVATALAVHPSVPAENARDLAALIKAKPVQLFYGHANVLSQLALETFAYAAGGKMTAVAYKGSGPSTQGLLAGEVQVLLAPADSVAPHAKAGTLRLIGLTGTRRSAAFPGVPTVAESVPGYSFENWHAIVLPAGTSAEIVTKLNAELVKAAQAPRVASKLAQGGSDVVAGTPAELKKRIETETAYWSKKIPALGFTKQ